MKSYMTRTEDVLLGRRLTSYAGHARVETAHFIRATTQTGKHLSICKSWYSSRRGLPLVVPYEYRLCFTDVRSFIEVVSAAYRHKHYDLPWFKAANDCQRIEEALCALLT